MPTLTPVDHDPFASGPPAGMKLTPVDHDPFDPAALAQSAAQAFRMPGPAAEAQDGRAFNLTAEAGKAPRASGLSDTLAGMFQGEQEYQNAAKQSTSLEVRDGQGNFKRPPLGKAYEMDDGNVYYDAPDGRPVLADKAKNVVLHDAQTNAYLVFDRTSDTDQNKLLSIGQMIAPSLATGPIGMGRTATGTARAAQNAARATEAEQDAAAFERAGVRPFGPAFSEGPMAATAKQVTEVPILGAPTRNALEESLTGARDATREVASRYGSATTAREAGQVVQEGLERFKDARPADVVDDAIGNLPDAEINNIINQPAAATSLKTKKAALYERAWRLIPEQMRGGRSVEDTSRVMQGPKNARATLDDIIDRIHGGMVKSGDNAAPRESAYPVTSGPLRRYIDAILTKGWTASLQTLRDIRSEFRRLGSRMGDAESNTLKHSDIDRIQSGITEDMVALLQRNADRYRAAGDHVTAGKFERSIREFRAADQYTRESAERLEHIERLFKAESAESLARNITNAALAGGKGNEQLLETLARTLRPEEMGEIASSIISELGRPVASARGVTQKIGFSVSSFLTNWQKMSDRAKALLFSGEHRQALDDVVRINSRLANVEALANTSRSTSNAMGIGGLVTGAGALAAGSAGAIQAAIGGAAATYGAALLFSRPAYVRWVIGYTRAKASIRGVHANVGANSSVVAQLNQLAKLARSDPALQPVMHALFAEDGVAEPADSKKQQK